MQKVTPPKQIQKDVISCVRHYCEAEEDENLNLVFGFGKMKITDNLEKNHFSAVVG